MLSIDVFTPLYSILYGFPIREFVMLSARAVLKTFQFTLMFSNSICPFGFLKTGWNSPNTDGFISILIISGTMESSKTLCSSFVVLFFFFFEGDEMLFLFS